MNDKIKQEFIEAFSSSEEDVTLTQDEKEFLVAFPNALTNLWKDTNKAILLHAWPSILAKQIEKAQGGDTTSTKFLADLIQPTDEDTLNPDATELPKWEELAIAIRDKVGSEYSAQDVVVRILTRVVDMDVPSIKSLLTSD